MTLRLPPPRLNAAGLWWWGIGLFLLSSVATWLYLGLQQQSSQTGPSSWVIETYAFLSPILTLMQLLGVAMIAGGLVVRALQPAVFEERKVGGDRDVGEDPRSRQ